MINERNALMHAIRTYSFAVTEAALFLDTHPENKEALDYYNKYNSLLLEAYDAYQEKYGPLTIYGGSDSNRWSWIQDAWPWENAANTLM